MECLQNVKKIRMIICLIRHWTHNGQPWRLQ